MPLLSALTSLWGVGFAVLDASEPATGPGSRGTAGLATFLFAVICILLFLFFAVVLLTTVSRALRRKKAAEPNAPTDVSVDPWSEAGKRVGKPKKRRGRSG